MELFNELLFTVFFALFFSLIVAKIVSIAASRETSDISLSSEGGMGALKREMDIERRVQIVEQGVCKVDRISSEILVDDDVAVERTREGGKVDKFDYMDEVAGEEKIDEHLADVRGDGDSFEGLGATGEKTEKIWVDDVEVERCEEVRLEGFDDVDEENAVSRVCEEKIVEYLEVDDEIVKNGGGDCHSFESLGATRDIIEKLGVSDVAVERRCEEDKLEKFDEVDEKDEVAGVFEEKIVEQLTMDDEIVQEGGSDGDSIESSGTVIDNIEKIGIEGDSQANMLGNDHDVYDQVVGVSEEKIVEYLKVGDKIVEDLGADGVSFECSGGIGENTKNIGIEGDIVVNSGSSDPVVDDEVAAQQRSEGSKMEDFVKHLGLDEDISESSESNDEKVESIGLASDIMVNLGTSNPVANYEMAVGEKSEGKKLEEFEEKISEHVGVENVGSENLGANVEIVKNVGVGGGLKLSSCDDVDEDDDWEGVERSELEKNFAAAANYVFYDDKNVCEPKLGSDVKMELYGLNKVALEGPCHESQPMAIMVSARAKWNAWQRLGNMSPEVAMEQYISLLSDKAPQWMEIKSSGDGSRYTSMVSESSPPDIGQLGPIKESVFLLNPATLECDLTGGSISVNKI